jgi:hypothetical protein
MRVRKTVSAIGFVTIVTLLALLTACQAVEHRASEAENTYYKIANSCEEEANSIGYQSLTDKTRFFNSDELTPEMMSLNRMADAAEKSTIARLAQVYARCGEKLVQHSLRYDGEISGFLRSLDIQRSLRQLESLHNEQLTWGDFNKEMRRYDLAFYDAFKKAQKSHWEGLYAKERAREMALLAVAEGLKAYGEAYGDSWRKSSVTNGFAPPPPQAIYDPKTLTCRTSGNQTFCTQNSALSSTPKYFQCLTNGNKITCNSQ